MISFNRKTVKNIYFFLNLLWFDALNNRYIYTNNQVLIYFFTKTKKLYSPKTQMASYTYSKYEKKRCLKAKKASV